MSEDTTDPFAGYQPVPGLEHLGRAITDETGAISGSPANYENSRGARLPIGRAARAATAAHAPDQIAAIAEEFRDPLDVPSASVVVVPPQAPA